MRLEDLNDSQKRAVKYTMARYLLLLGQALERRVCLRTELHI